MNGEGPNPANPEVPDATANMYHGTAKGTEPLADQTEGIIGNVLDFDGTDDYVEFGSAILDEFSENLSISLWFNTDSMGNLVTAADSFSFSLEVLADSTAHFVIPDSSGDTTYECDTSAIQPGTWYHLTADYDNQNMRLFLNGVLAESRNAPGLLRSFTGPLGLAWDPVDSLPDFFLGQIDELRMGNQLRTEAWIKMSYENQRDQSSVISISNRQ
jgi:hypothetical protein